jgi:hypothetical protein
VFGLQKLHLPDLQKPRTLDDGGSSMTIRGCVFVVFTLVACGSSDRGSLVRVDPEPAGVHCPDGGVSINTGLDNDRDHFLDDNEITSTQFVCNGTPIVQCNGGTIISGTITVRAAADLAQLAGANCVDGDLLIVGTDFTGIDLRDLQTVTGDVVVAGNEQLTSLDGIGSIRDLGRGYLLQGNPQLTSLGALGNIRTASQISIVANDGLADLHGLESIIDTTAGITIANNNALASLAGLDNLTSATHTISIRGNQALTSVDALANARSLHIIEISGNPELPQISLPSLEKTAARVLINSNANLVTLDFPALTTMGEFLQANGNDKLQSINAPNLLTTSGVLVTSNGSLQSLAMPNLVLTTGKIDLTGNLKLAQVDFGALESTGDSMTIANTPLLPNFNGFAHLSSIGGTFTVSKADALTDFTGLGALTEVSGDMVVSVNARLSGFGGLSALQTVGNNLSITNNPMCLRTTAQAFANSIAVGGTVTIN